MGNLVDRLFGWTGYRSEEKIWAQQERSWLLRTTLDKGHERQYGRSERLINYINKTQDWTILPAFTQTEPRLAMGVLHLMIKRGMKVSEKYRKQASDALVAQDKKRLNMLSERVEHLKREVAHTSVEQTASIMRKEFRRPSGKEVLRAAFPDTWQNYMLPKFGGPVAGPPGSPTPTQRKNMMDSDIQSALIQRNKKDQKALERERQAAHALLLATGMADYPAFFPQARALKREFVFHSGPTNSGKTHQAMQELMSAPTGVYLAPLRLLALEGYDKLANSGLPARLLTGDDKEETQRTVSHISSTVEMLDTHTEVDVVVVDEVQLLMDAQRGWAWTRAIIGAPAKTVILVGSPDALPIIQKLCKITGDNLVVVEHQRRSKLVASQPIDLEEMRDGDAIVAFSRTELFDLRARLVAYGYDVAMLYGGLSPEVRRAEACRFRTGRANILVATDAIGMGLNLPIKRIVLGAGMKHDGQQFRALKDSEIRQICGRAGRGSENGVACFLQNAPRALNAERLQSILDTQAQGSNDLPYVSPPFSAVQTVARREDSDRLGELLKLLSNQAMETENFRPSNLSSNIQAAEIIQNSGLSLKERYVFSLTPLDEDDLPVLRDWAYLRAKGNTASVPNPVGPSLKSMEETSKRLVAWMWLNRRFPDTFADIEGAQYMRTCIETVIKEALSKRKIPEHLDWQSSNPSADLNSSITF